jgi:hypothetical protein
VAAGGGNGGLSGRPLINVKGPKAHVPETRDLTMKQMAVATMEAGLCPVKPLSWWFGTGH